MWYIDLGLKITFIYLEKAHSMYYHNVFKNVYNYRKTMF